MKAYIKTTNLQFNAKLYQNKNFWHSIYEVTLWNQLATDKGLNKKIFPRTEKINNQ